MYVLLFWFILPQLAVSLQAMNELSEKAATVPTLGELAGKQLLYHHHTLESQERDAHHLFDYYTNLCQNNAVPDTVRILFARCMIASHNTQSINTFNKNVPTHAYTQLAYDVFSNTKLHSSDKIAITIFLRDYPEKLEKKTAKILDFLIEYHQKVACYITNPLLYACHNSFKPTIFKFLLNKGTKPPELVIWDLIGNKKSFPPINKRQLEKLKYLTSLSVTILPSPINPFDKTSALKPLEYAKAMLVCWHDENWTRGFLEKRFECYNNLTLKLQQFPSSEVIKQYRNFYTEVVTLLEKSKNIMPDKELQTS